MARTVRDAKLETRAARDRLKRGPTPHFKTLVPGRLHLGYRRKKKDAPGQWIVRAYLGGERYRKAPLGFADDFEDMTPDNGFISFAEAQRRAHAYRVEQKTGRRGGMTVEDAMADYVKSLRGERDAAADHAERTAAKLILPTLGRTDLADLTTDAIIDWRNDLAKEPARLRTRKGEAQKFRPAPTTKEAQRARRATANRVMGVLKAALNRAFSSGRVPDDLAWRRAKPFRQVGAARPGHLTVAESKRLINAADPESGFRDMVRAALMTGCRYGELCALDVRDFSRGKLHIRTSKSGRPRDVVLTDEAIAFFEQLTAGRPGGDPLLKRIRRVDGDERWQTAEQARPMRAACQAAKIEPVGIHQLRHTYASLAIMNGMPLLVLARNLGHRDTRMVETHYGHLAESYIDREIRESAPTFGFRPSRRVVAIAK